MQACHAVTGYMVVPRQDEHGQLLVSVWSDSAGATHVVCPVVQRLPRVAVLEIGAGHQTMKVLRHVLLVRCGVTQDVDASGHDRRGNAQLVTGHATRTNDPVRLVLRTLETVRILIVGREKLVIVGTERVPHCVGSFVHRHHANGGGRSVGIPDTRDRERVARRAVRAPTNDMPGGRIHTDEYPEVGADTCLHNRPKPVPTVKQDGIGIERERLVCQQHASLAECTGDHPLCRYLWWPVQRVMAEHLLRERGIDESASHGRRRMLGEQPVRIEPLNRILTLRLTQCARAFLGELGTPSIGCLIFSDGALSIAFRAFLESLLCLDESKLGQARRYHVLSVDITWRRMDGSESAARRGDAPPVASASHRPTDAFRSSDYL